jgi:enoyl-CoA hydratase/carnithine racemase
MSEVLTSLQQGVARIVINRPHQRNALNSAVLLGLRRALRDASDRSDVRVITLTGEGDQVFCAGADLKASLAEGDHFVPSDFRQLLLDIHRCPKPTVALARGHVMAGGLGLFLACDLSLACDDVHFSTPEIHVGMFPMMVLALLYRVAGRRKATEMIFLGERMSAAVARDCGIVNQVFPRETFDSAADAFVRRLAEKSGAILRLGKEAIGAVEDLPLPGALEYLESALARLMKTDDSREGIRAFLEKRKPRWIDD